MTYVPIVVTICKLTTATDYLIFTGIPEIIRKTSLAWLQDNNEDKARSVYEGSYNLAGEVQSSASLARQFPDYAALTADGQFPAWSERLYQSPLDSNPRALEEDAA